MTKRPSVALIGPGAQENLSLGYLASAAEAAGHRAFILRCDTRADITACVRDVSSIRPDAVGLSIVFQYTIDDYAALARALRAAGYPGHITCGGHVPTFCYEPLLTEEPAIDSVVRHEGEETLVALLQSLGRGEAPRDISGLVWRENGDIRLGAPRLPPADLDTLPYPKRRTLPFAVAGYPMAFVLASRGCVGHCAYCSIRAFAKDSGGAPYRMRRPEALADEIVLLRHRYGVRVVLLQDDLFLLPDEQACIERCRAIARALHARDVNDVIFWMKGRPDSVTDDVLAAVKEMGGAYLFLGVENASVERLRYLGRRHRPEDAARAIDRCLAHDITPCFNFMLFDPDCSLCDIETNLDFAATYTDLPWNLCRTEIYPGTRLYERLAREGRLMGDFRTLGYQMRDRSAERLFRMFRVAFQDRSLRFDSLHNQLITLAFSAEVARRLSPTPANDTRYRSVRALMREANSDTLAELGRMIVFTRETDPDDLAQNRDFAVERTMAINALNHEWRRRMETLK